MLYEPNETKTSQKQLEHISKLLKGSACLLGGWAVYHIVNNNFEKTNGKPYIGSRDIDIGFHIDKNWTEKQLRESGFVSAISAIERNGFRSVSFRLVKDFDLETGKELDPEESAKRPLYQIFQLFIDPKVDYIHPNIKDALGFVPIDEPLLSLLFQHKMYTTTNLFGTKVMIPKPELLLVMNLNSALRRNKKNHTHIHTRGHRQSLRNNRSNHKRNLKSACTTEMITMPNHMLRRTKENKSLVSEQHSQPENRWPQLRHRYRCTFDPKMLEASVQASAGSRLTSKTSPTKPLTS